MLENTALKLLIEVAKLKEPTSTVNLADVIAVSQQSVSRVLSELEKEGLIRKSLLSDGLRLELTGKGRLALLALQGKISNALQEKPTLTLRGHLTKGLGEGKYYVSLNHYQDELTRILGQEPWPGTLNLRVNPEERALFLAGIEPVEIKGFSAKERTYGSVLFYPIRIGDRDCGLLLPTRTTYGPEKVEIVDSIELRPALQLKEGDEIVIERRVKS